MSARFPVFRIILTIALSIGPLLLSPTALKAGEADVVMARIIPDGANTYRIDVTVRHADAGWDHYADAWQVLGPDGQLLATRVLAHPHVEEQPFTRSLSGIKIPAEVHVLTIRAHDKVHGTGGTSLRLKVP